MIYRTRSIEVGADFDEGRTGLIASRRALLKAGALGAAGTVWAASSWRRALAAPATQGAPGGQLVIAKPHEITGFDPMSDATQTSWELHALVYESLVWLDDNLAPVPGLAESWDTPDDRTYVFHIRQGVSFHNGREMTADDVAFSLRRVVTDPISWWNVKMGPVSAADPAAAATAETLGSPVPGPQIGLTFEATGPYEVTARLTEPYAPFLYSLTGTTTAILPAQEVQTGAVDLSTQMVGTGPFMVSDHSEGQHWALTKHAGYWQTEKPRLDQIVWRIMTDESARVAALRTGEVQLAFFDNAKLLDLLAADSNVTTLAQPTTNYYILIVNGRTPELSDTRVRQAISLAVDREQMRDLALFGRAQVTGPVAAPFTQLATPIADLPFYTRDVGRAKQLLTEAGYGDGLKLQVIITPDLSATVTMAQLLKAQLAEVGIDLEIVQRDLATFVNEYAIEGTAQLAITWWAGYSDPYLILVTLSSSSFGPIIGLDDPAVDELITQAARETDPTARLQVLHDLEAAIATSANFQPLITRDNLIAYRKDLLGDVAFTAADGFGLPLWHNVVNITRTQ
jgi:peptide/nickel transport system substrate-binding protein